MTFVKHSYHERCRCVEYFVYRGAAQPECDEKIPLPVVTLGLAHLCCDGTISAAAAILSTNLSEWLDPR